MNICIYIYSIICVCICTYHPQLKYAYLLHKVWCINTCLSSPSQHTSYYKKPNSIRLHQYIYNIMAMQYKLACAAVLLCMVAIAPSAEAAISCSTVYSDLMPCLGYMMGSGKQAVPAACCSGINSLYNAAVTTADRQSVCSCIKSAAKGVSLDVNRAATVLSKCGVSVPYKITADMDCSKVE